MTKILLMNSYAPSSRIVSDVSYNTLTGDVYWTADPSFPCIPRNTIITLKKREILIKHNGNGFQISYRQWNDDDQSLLWVAIEKLLEHYSIDYNHDGNGFYCLKSTADSTKMIFYLPHFFK